MSFSASNAMNNDPTFSSVELIGGLSAVNLNWNEQSDLKVSGGLLIRDNLLSTGNIKVPNHMTIDGQAVIYGTLDGIAGSLTLVGDITPLDANVSGNIYWNGLTVFGATKVNGKTIFYDELAQLALIGNCLINDTTDTKLCANEDDTISWHSNGRLCATLETNGGFKFAKANVASGINSFSEGWNCQATGAYSHCEGNVSVAGGDYSHVIAFHSSESGESNHVEGRQHDVTGAVNHVEGAFAIVEGQVNTVLSLVGGTFSSDNCHIESAGTVFIAAGSDTCHVEAVCQISSDIGLDHLESHGPSISDDLRTLSGTTLFPATTLLTGLSHSDSGKEQAYHLGYCSTSSLAQRSLIKAAEYASVIGPDACVNQFGMCAIAPGTVNSTPFGTLGGSTFTTPDNASVGHGHAQLSLFHLKGTTGTTGTAPLLGNLSLTVTDSLTEVFPELIYRGTDSTVTNSEVLRQVWNVNLSVVGRDTSTSSCFGQNIHFNAIHNTLGTAIQIANIDSNTPITLGSSSLVGSSVNIDNIGNQIRVYCTTNSTNTVHWSGTMRVINTGVMDFTGELVNSM